MECNQILGEFHTLKKGPGQRDRKIKKKNKKVTHGQKKKHEPTKKNVGQKLSIVCTRRGSGNESLGKDQKKTPTDSKVSLRKTISGGRGKLRGSKTKNIVNERQKRMKSPFEKKKQWRVHPLGGGSFKSRKKGVESTFDGVY